MKRLYRFLADRQNQRALTIVAFYILVAAYAPTLAPPDNPDAPRMFKIVGRPTDNQPHPPGNGALLGTLPGQVDIFYTLVWGARHALRLGLVAALTTGCLGVLVGAVSGYVGGTTNSLLLRITDAFLTFPMIAGMYLFREVMTSSERMGDTTSLFLTLMQTLRLDPLMLTLILFSWMPYARIINASVTRLRGAEYIVAAMSLGASGPRIIFRHMLPNVISPAIVLVARDIGAMVLLEATFTFIRIGGFSPWGMLLVVGRNYIVGPYANPLAYWWVYLPATLALILFGVGWNLLGDGLNSLLDPRSYAGR
jgi:peptide/nickel transport system permease protein